MHVTFFPCAWTFISTLFVTPKTGNPDILHWERKLTVVYASYKTAVSHEKEQTTEIPNNLYESSENDASEKKPILKRLYEFIYTTFLKWQNHKKGEQISGF